MDKGGIYLDFKFIWNKKLVIECNLLFIANILSIVLITTGIAAPFIHCFAVDNQGLIYVGLENEIQVYDKNQHIRSISPQTSRGFMFTINKDNTILLSTADTVFSMDLDGNILSSHPDPGADTYNQIQYRKNHFTTQKGDTYKIVSSLGWSRIVKNGATVVYQISSISFITKMMLYISFCITFALPISYICKARRKTQHQEDISDKT